MTDKKAMWLIENAIKIKENWEYYCDDGDEYYEYSTETYVIQIYAEVDLDYKEFNNVIEFWTEDETFHLKIERIIPSPIR